MSYAHMMLTRLRRELPAVHRPATSLTMLPMTLIDTSYVTVLWPVERTSITAWQYNPVGGWAYTLTPRMHELRMADLLAGVPVWEQRGALTKYGPTIAPATFTREARRLLMLHRPPASGAPACAS